MKPRKQTQNSSILKWKTNCNKGHVLVVQSLMDLKIIIRMIHRESCKKLKFDYIKKGV